MELSEELDAPEVKKFLRGEAPNLEVLKDKKLKGQLSVREEFYGISAKAAAKAAKWLMPSEGGFLEAEGLEKTWRIKQEAIAKEVDVLSSRNQYDIVLPDLGPYTLDFTSSGRYMAVAGRKGHAIVDMQSMNLIREIQVRETVCDAVFLHNELFFAAAQKKYTYIYNRDGTELHCLREHGAVLKLQFLKNHFLLASINKFGQLHYQDVTMGEMIGNFRTGLGRTNVMEVNPFNGVVALGHSGGTVTMWNPLVSLLLSRCSVITGLYQQWHSTLMAISWPHLVKKEKSNFGTSENLRFFRLYQGMQRPWISVRKVCLLLELDHMYRFLERQNLRIIADIWGILWQKVTK
ncbi:U3 small nucleolar RNA-associated protein 7-like [Tripterygium wilfordii]|uniref:U3 small nucleolar RNA-associated protein 7-like n=1 Tax=Tripterygium wilfordii TaxID=458696 RepID=A0A7J7BUQ5_TRIWF|nr:U3 small nucleolar RNA-associated protein 7-like [Tripterygium wilfordii]